ncbi:MAG: ATP-dependent helicase [Candidatus Sericytochromatia bacterium]
MTSPQTQAGRLNERQQQAVLFGEGPLLVLAGAGAGKTRVLTQRVAQLVQQRSISASRILVVTFTNKAAKEMKARLENLIGPGQVDKLWVGTFHAICARLLRQEIDLLGGYTRRFAIYDPDDQEKLMKATLAQLDLDPSQHRPRSMLKKISELKNRGLLPADYRRQAHEFDEMLLARVYAAHQENLAKNNALDFDDLLLLALQLLRRHPAIMQRYQTHFQYVLVDEYQDTNSVQFELVRLLAEPQNNIFVVGDVDQSIYSFRNADFQIILRFQQDYPGAAVIKLEENYRSTRPILEAANTLIDYNRDRFDKVLVSVRGEGEAIRFHTSRNEYQEADYVLSQIRQLVDGGYDYGDVCVLYRTNAQSRLFEERLVQSNIPHQILGAFRFYERKEIKDLIAYLAVLYNPLDSLALRRIVNTPKRGIGSKSLQNLDRAAEREGLSLWDALNSESILASLPKRTRAPLDELVKFLNANRDFSCKLHELIEKIYVDSGYRAELAKDEESFEEREAYVISFLQAARDFVPASPDTLLGDFLQHLALISDIDHLKDEGRLVRLMTVHAAKGLEFPVVFITGLEEGVFPHLRSIRAEEEGDDGPIEEERRLMYVAMTRAQDLLYMSHARQRTVRGEPAYAEASRFLEEIEAHLPAAVSPGSSLDKPSVMWDAVPVPDDEPQGLAGLSAGERVYHPDFGRGVVDRVYASGARQIAIVLFEQGYGKRILDLRSAPLERI